MIYETQLPAVRRDSFDSIKGLACIGVVFIHVLFPEPLKIPVKCMSRFSVPVFFLTSGFFFAEGGVNCQPEKITKKIRHIMMLILNAAFFFTIFMFIFKPHEISNWSPMPYLKERATAGKLAKLFITNEPLAFGHMWFLLALFYIYLFSLCFFADNKRLRYSGWIGVFLLFGYVMLQEFADVTQKMRLHTGVQIPESNETLYFCNLFLFRALPFFLIGISLRKNEKRIQEWKLPRTLFLFLFISFVVISAWEWTLTNNYTQYYVSSIFAALTLLIFAIKWSWRPHFLYFIGSKLSLYIYIFHIPVQKSLDIFFRKRHLSSSPFIVWTMPIMVLTVTILFSIFFLLTRNLINKARLFLKEVKR